MKRHFPGLLSPFASRRTCPRMSLSPMSSPAHALPAPFSSALPPDHDHGPEPADDEPGGPPLTPAAAVRTPGWVPTGDSVRIVPWIDRLIDPLGHDPRSLYVEQFWLGILGPSTTWLLRRLADRFQRDPDGFDLALEDTA